MENDETIQEENSEIITNTEGNFDFLEDKESAKSTQQTESSDKFYQSITENHGNVIGNINYGETFKDPTTVWDFGNNQSTLKLDKKDIKSYADLLIKERLIVFHCYDKKIINNTIEDIVNYIINKEKINSSYKRLLSFQRKDDDIDDNKPFEENQNTITLSTFIKEDFANSKACFIKTKLIQSEFYKSLFIEEKESFEAIKAELTAKNIFFICYVQEAALINTIQSKRHASFSQNNHNIERNFFFPFYQIPFLPIILQFHFKERWADIRNMLIAQKEQGFWGRGKTERELFNGISSYLEEGVKKLENEIEKRRMGDFQENLAIKIETLPFKRKVHLHILFITAYFPEISINEFNLIVNMLLEGKTKDHLKKTVDNENEIEGATENKTILLRDIWESNGDEILHDCNIITSSLESGQIYFDFEEPELIDEVRTNIKKRYFLFFQDQFQTIINSGIFFDIKASNQLINNMLDNITEMIPYDPNFYGINLLNWLFLKTFTQNKIQLKKKIEELNEEELEYLNNYINQQEFVREIGFNRLMDLIRIMLGKEKLLSQQALNFIEYLFRKQQFLVVLRIVENLQNSPHINALEWIRKILNQKEAKGDLHYECILSLYKIANLNTYETFDVLEKIHHWSVNTSNRNLTLSQSNSILLILFFGNPLYGHFPLAHYGKWPSRFFLFNFNEKNIKKTWIFLIKWLFHPSMAKAYRVTDNRDGISFMKIEETLTNVQAFILESWYLILNGIDQQAKLKSLQKNATQEFFNTLINELTPVQQLSLKRQWAVMSRAYIQEADKAKIKNNAQLKALYHAKKCACRILYNNFN